MSGREDFDRGKLGRERVARAKKQTIKQNPQNDSTYKSRKQERERKKELTEEQIKFRNRSRMFLGAGIGAIVAYFLIMYGPMLLNSKIVLIQQDQLLRLGAQRKMLQQRLSSESKRGYDEEEEEEYAVEEDIEGDDEEEYDDGIDYYEEEEQEEQGSTPAK